jgi:predicted nucleic acid-binding protein
MYLFDTDVIIAFLRGTVDSDIRRKIATVPANRQYISTVSVSELVIGLTRDLL